MKAYSNAIRLAAQAALTTILEFGGEKSFSYRLELHSESALFVSVRYLHTAPSAIPPKLLERRVTINASKIPIDEIMAHTEKLIRDTMIEVKNGYIEGEKIQ